MAGGAGVLAALAAFWPAELGKKADPFAPAPIGIKPEWYFMFMFQTLKYLPGYILGIEGELVGVLGFAWAASFSLLIPFLDRRAARGEPSRLVHLDRHRHHRVHARVDLPRLHGQPDEMTWRRRSRAFLVGAALGLAAVGTACGRRRTAAGHGPRTRRLRASSAPGATMPREP